MNSLQAEKRNTTGISKGWAEPGNACLPLPIYNDVERMLSMLAPLDMDIVVEGETGTGKDTFAQRLYQAAGVKGAFVPVNCAAIPEQLAESELFGVVSGAYTGASHTRAGYIESAQQGMLFLDEIDSMPLTLQAKLLRVLETRSVTRLGCTRAVPLKFRVVVAAQRPLSELVAQNRFRQDLYFRLSTVRVELPTLRSHIESIIPLFRHFTQQSALRLKCPLPPMPVELTEILLMHSWPGNIRELRAAAERFVIGLPVIVPPVETGKVSGRLKDRLRRIESCLIEDCLARHKNRVVSAAHELGIPRRTLYQRLKLLNVEN
ncbi:sigma 54-interacting transcriptional regulator [[Erwinia] mediterraneensis]|uniref:sigma 54-interacting transcriptional regulator n=1 Tax=[Erwinia] mediterraneensis TaxID=2161819 RepID=UPI0010324428